VISELNEHGSTVLTNMSFVFLPTFDYRFDPIGAVLGLERISCPAKFRVERELRARRRSVTVFAVDDTRDGLARKEIDRRGCASISNRERLILPKTRRDQAGRVATNWDQRFTCLSIIHFSISSL
jgi:hypothetical protein